MEEFHDIGNVIVRLKDVDGKENCTKIHITNGTDNRAILVTKDQFKEAAKKYFDLK